MKMSHDRFGNLRRTSRMTTENYGKKQHKMKDISKMDIICRFSLSSKIKTVVSVRYFLMLRVDVKIVQNNQQIKELQAAYKIVSGSTLA